MNRQEWSNLVTKLLFWIGTTLAWAMQQEILAMIMSVFLVIDVIIMASAYRKYKVQRQIAELKKRQENFKSVSYDVPDIQPPTPPKTPTPSTADSIFEHITR